jgi:hypothetical protein
VGRSGFNVKKTEEKPMLERRAQLFIITLAFGVMLSGNPGIAQSDAQLRLEVLIPSRTVMYVATTDTATNEPARTQEGWTTVFDLSCATLGALPPQCQGLYGGPLLDTQGRPYPPVEVDSNGRVTKVGSFPQFFDAASRTVRLYTPAANWRIQVEFVDLAPLRADNFAVYSNHGGWHCLGYHPDWLDAATCSPGTDAAKRPVSVAEVTGNNGGWHDIALQLRLRLDGSEPSGSYSGVLRYTLASF